MPNSLESTIHALANRLAEELVRSLRSMNLHDLVALTQGAASPRGRSPSAAKAPGENASPARPRRRQRKLARRGAEDIQKVIESVVALLKANKGGLRAEQLQAELKLDRRELPRPIAKALEDKVITKKGAKRSTTYFAK